MSVWDRMRGLFGRSPPREPPDAAGEAELDHATGPRAGSEPLVPLPVPTGASRAAALTPLEELERVAAQGSVDDALAAEAFDRAVRAGSQGPAIDVGRRIVARGGGAGRSFPELRLRVAEVAFFAGDDHAAQALIQPLMSDPNGALAAWMLGAELAEKRGDVALARSLYERIVARDFSFPRARERARRLREASMEKPRDIGATLLGGSAETRRFRLREELGRGGAGTVFLADEPALDRTVALKVYHRRGRADRERLLVEARSAASFSDPGVVRVLDVDEALHAIAMEPLLLGSVKTQKDRGASETALVGWLLSVARTLSHVHAHGLVHCDLKPSNFLVRGPGEAVLTDFGLARRRGEPPAERGEGTLAYMSPEQRAGAPADPATDAYALGVCIRELVAAPSLLELSQALTTRRPEDRPNVAEVLQALERARP